MQTVRGGTLNAVAFAFGAEVVEVAMNRHPVIAEALREVLPYAEDDEAPLDVDAWLAKCWEHRGLSFGSPDLRAPDSTSDSPGEDGAEGAARRPDA
jgi:hypothetical protein